MKTTLNISGRIPSGKDRAIKVKHKVEEAGWRNVTTGWDPQHQTYTVTGDQPNNSGR